MPLCMGRPPLTNRVWQYCPLDLERLTLSHWGVQPVKTRKAHCPGRQG